MIWQKNQKNHVFKAASETANILTALQEFENGEQPSAKWFPKKKNGQNYKPNKNNEMNRL